MEKDCIFCKIISNEIPSFKIYEDENTIAFLDVNPNSNGHTLVVPKKHSLSFSTTDLKQLKNVTFAKYHVAKLLREKLNPKGFNFISNDGSEAFQIVNHYHEHVIPKYEKAKGFTFKIESDYLIDVKDIFKKITD